MNIGSGESNSQDFELNLASIIDCFTVLITFMLASSAFLSIGIFDAGIAAAGATQNPAPPPPINVSIELKGSHTMAIKVSGKENNVLTVTPSAAKQDDWNFEAMNGRLEEIKKKWPGLTAMTLTAENAVEYKDIIKTMDAVHKTMPAVLLGGF